MLITVMISDHSPPGQQPAHALADRIGDEIGEQLGVRDRRGLMKLDLLLNLRDHRSIERTTYVQEIVGMLANVAHVLVIVVGEIPAARLGVATRDLPRWKGGKDHSNTSWIAIPSGSSRTRFWRDPIRRRMVLETLSIAFDSCDTTTRIAATNVLTEALGIPDAPLVDRVLRRHELGEIYLRYRYYGWKMGDRIETLFGPLEGLVG